MYDPPSKPARPFEADYPAGARTDAFGNLTHDIEGRPLHVGGRIVGRRVVGGADEALPAAEFDAVSTAATTRGTEIEQARKLAGDAGRYVETRDRRSGQITDNAILLSDRLTREQLPRVYGHEIGHVIDQLAGEIPTRGLSGELKALYNTLNNPNRTGGEAASWGRPSTPQASGYSDGEVPREFMAEAIRAYMADPNYLKTEAPKTAAAIRAAVNANPEVSRIIQFNMGGSPLAAALAGPATPAKQSEVDWEKLYRSGGAI